jgi:uncharacterized protein YggE
MELTIKHYVLLIVTILALIGVNQWISNPLMISVSGVGEVSVPATKAIVSLTLSERDATPDGALARIQDRALQFRDYMKQKGFDEVVTTQPQMVPAGLISPTLTGYQVTVSMGGSTTQLNNLHKIVAGFYGMGATVVSQPVLAVDDEAKLVDEALKEALKKADDQAKQVARRQMKLIRVVASVQQADSGITSTSTSEKQNQDGVVESGDIFKISKAVSVTYKLW